MSKLYKITDENFSKLVAESESGSALLKACGYRSLSHNIDLARKRVQELGLSTKHFNAIKTSKVARTPENTLVKGAYDVHQSVLKRIYTKGNYSPYRCAICNQEPFGNGKELVLTLDHINGDHYDNRVENLRGVCPNCDRQLDTYAGRNLSKGHTFELQGHQAAPQPIAQIDPATGRLIRQWPSIGSIVSALKIDSSGLTRATQHPDRYKAKGFIGKRIED